MPQSTEDAAGRQDLLLYPSYSILRVQCIYNGFVVVLTSPHFSLCPICFSVSNVPVLWFGHLMVSVVISQNWMSTNQQITTTRSHPTTEPHCSFGTGFDGILPTDLS